ncbi:MAG: hypothetical protein Q4D26_12480 [Clostridia bacterium]|nr:hypothetical protein [Clostridia bacterium]
MKKIIFLLFNVIKIISVIFTGLILISLIGIIAISLIFHEPHSAKRIESEFFKYKDNIVEITNYLIKNEYDNIYISDTMESGMCFAYNEDIALGRVGGNMAIGNTNIEEKINYLFQKCNYQMIEKSNNVIIFQRWSNIGVNSGGLVYMINGEYPQIEFISKCEPLEYKGWYYFETDSRTG